MADHLVHRGQHVLGLLAVLLRARDLFRRRRELVERRRRRGVERVAAAEEQEVLGAVLLVNLLLVRQVVADRVTWKSPVSISTSTALTTGGVKSRFLYLRVPRRLVLEVGGVLRQVHHHVGHRLVGDGDEALRRALGAARVAVDLDEAVGEIHGGVVPHPVAAELQPVLAVAGLVEANQIRDDRRLRRIRDGARLLQDTPIAFFEIRRVEPRRDLAVRRAGAVDLFANAASRPSRRAS